MESTESDFRTLFLLFYEIFQFSEGHYSGVDAKILFKSAKIVEDTYLKLENLEGLEEFESKLNKFWALKGLNCIPLQFFKKASHLVLSKYMADNKFSDADVKLAIQQFLLINSEKEFVELVKELNHIQCSVEILKQNSDISAHISDYNSSLCLVELKKHLMSSNGDVEKVDSIITKMFCKNNDNFKLFLKLLCLPNDCELSLCVQELVALYTSNLLKDSDNLNLYDYVLGLSDEDFYHIVTQWHLITDSVINMIEYSIKKLQCSYTNNSFSWSYTGTEKILTFENITALISRFISLPEKCEQIKRLLHKLGQEGFVMIAEDLLRICKIK